MLTQGAPRRTLTIRLLAIYAVAVVVLIGLVGLFVERIARDALLAAVEDGLADQARVLSVTVPEDPADVQAFLDDLAPAADARITVIAADGRVLGDTHADRETMENHATRPEVLQALDGGVGVARRVSASTGFPQLYVAVDAPGPQILRLSLPENVVTAPISEFRNRLMLLVALAVLVGTAVVGIVARRLASPLRRLTDAAAEVASGNLEVDVPRSGVEELDRLGRAVTSMASDLGERLKETQAQRRTLELVLDSIPQGTLLVDAAGAIIYANRSLIDLLGPVPDHLDQVVPYRIQEVVRRSRGQESPTLLDTEHGRPARVFRVLATPFDDGRVLVVMSDVTERRRIDDVRRDFVTNASHELKTPVSSILASAETLQTALERAPERVPRFASQIENAARALARLVGDLLDLSRLEGAVVEFKSFDLEQVVQGEIERMRPAALQQGVVLDSELAPIRLTGAASDLGLAVRNLVDNGIRFTGEGGSVMTRLHRDGDEAVITVTDTGVGIPQRDLDRIFERFYRVDEARSRATGGTGLGLSIVRHVVGNHGGEVKVTSELGSGSTFTIRLPVEPLS